MKRRGFFAASAATATTACFGEVDMSTNSNGQPWKMWGSTEIVEGAISPSAASTLVGSQQLAKIAYGRPDTWSFFFGGRVVGGPPAPVSTVDIRLTFQLIVGVGRDVFNTEKAATVGFATLRWLLAPGLGVQTLQPKWTTVAETPATDDGVVGSERLIEFFPAEQIQCKANLSVLTAAPPPDVLTYQVAATALFAPRTHVRPDWWKEQGEQFEGGELGGK